MEKKKDIDIYTEARRRSALASVSAVDTMLGATSAEMRERAMEKREHERELARRRSMRYRNTPKGKAANNRKCKTYQRKHRQKVSAYVRRWQESFEKRTGMKYGTYRYRIRHGLPVPKEAE